MVDRAAGGQVQIEPGPNFDWSDERTMSGMSTSEERAAFLAADLARVMAAYAAQQGDSDEYDDM